MECGRTREEGTLLRECGRKPDRQQPWLALAEFYYQQEEWPGVIFAARRALRLPGEEEWKGYDLLSAALYYTGDLPRALAMGEEALKRRPMDSRLRENLRRIRRRIETG